MTATTPGAPPTEMREPRGGSSGRSQPSPATADRQRRFRPVVKDPWRKLAAVVLAIGLWLFVDSNITKEETVAFTPYVVDSERQRMPLDVSESHSALEVRLPTADFTAGKFLDRNNREITDIQVHFKGPAHLISEVTGGLRLRVTLQPQVGDDYVEFTKDDIKGDSHLMRMLDGITPSFVRVPVEQNGAFELTLSHDQITFLEADAEQLKVDQLKIRDTKFIPGTVTFRGTRSALDVLKTKYRSERIFRAVLRNAREAGSEVRVDLQLQPEVAQLGITCEPENPEALIPIDAPMKPYSMRAPVVFDCQATDFAASDFERLPEVELTLRVRGRLDNELNARTPEQLNQWALKHVRVVVILPPDYSGEVTTYTVDPILVFPNFPEVVREKDYQFIVEPAISVTLKRQND